MGFDILTIVVISLLLSFLCSEFFFRFCYPRVISQILAGMPVRSKRKMIPSSARKLMSIKDSGVKISLTTGKPKMIRIDLSSLSHNIYLAIMVVLVATAAKILGALLSKPFTSFTFRQLYLIGWGLNSRGAIELVIAQIAFSADLIPIEVYSTLVIMAIVTTMVFPFMLKLIVSCDRSILNEHPSSAPEGP